MFNCNAEVECSLFSRKGVSSESLKVNGQPRDEKMFRKLSCYITQEEVLQPMLTLQEVMMFAADLKLPSGTSTKQKLQLIEDIQMMLGLKDSASTRTEKLSGGQKKRLSIALELINNPPVIFLDEPTSGLDNVSTTYTLKLLRKLAHQGRTVVCTIHQPSASLFQLFDHVYVLSQGLCVYQGSTDQLVPFLSEVGFHCPTHYNPADFVIEITDQDHEDNIVVLSAATKNGKLSQCSTKSDNKPIFSPLNRYSFLNDSNNNNNNNTKVIDNHKFNNNNNILSNKDAPSECQNVDQNGSLCLVNEDAKQSTTILCVDFPTSCWSQFYTLWRRMTLQIYRNKIGLNIQLYHHLGCAIMLGVVFFDKAKDGTDYFSHLKFCIGIALFHTFTYCMIPVITFPTQMKLLKREHFNRWYGMKAYYVAVQLTTLPNMVVFNLVFLSIVYLLTGLPLELPRFVVFCCLGILISITAEGMGLFIGSIFNITNGSAVAPLTLAPFLGLATYGFDFARDIPWYIAFLMKLSFLRSGVVGVVIAVFGMERKPLQCHKTFCLFADPKTLMQFLDLEFTSVWSQIGYLCMIMAAFRIGMYISLKYKLSY